MFAQFKTVEETDITGIEKAREAELQSMLASWKTKYEENDASWRKRYKERFEGKGDDFHVDGSGIEHYDAPTKFEDLFTLESEVK